METNLMRLVLSMMIYRYSQQHCPEEASDNGIYVTWPRTQDAAGVQSEPLCYCNDTLVTRNCTDDRWVPSLNETSPCLEAVKYFDLTSCPPGYYKISEENSNYCFQITEASNWNFPCFTSGGASVITDLSDTEINYLVNFLEKINSSRYFWLPAQRQKLFNPVVWYTPGPNWGTTVSSPNNTLAVYTPFNKHCLLFDTEYRLITTGVCSNILPSLCFYLSDLYKPAKCPKGYHSFRFKPDNTTCFGIEKSDNIPGLSFSEFLQSKCKKPMMDSKYSLTRFIFKELAELNNISNDVWCWFGFQNHKIKDNKNVNINNSTEIDVATLQGVINNSGVLRLIDSSSLLSCMACETDLIYGETQLMFNYNEDLNKMYLTVYYPSGLWKYNINDKGIQCFSDAKGFVKVIEVNNTPLMEVKYVQEVGDLEYFEKVVYVIDLVTDSSAQYWCEGHTVNFSLITTEKIVVNPKGHKIHVFSLVIQYYIIQDDIQHVDNLTDLTLNITEIFNARKVLLMEILDYAFDQIMILFHLHVDVEDNYENEAQNIKETFHQLELKAASNFYKYNYTSVNMSSSTFCLPTTSNDISKLDWEMTPIGHITAPNQFCLQSNGLPVTRHCGGSYKLGSIWGEIEGQCDTNYKPSNTTAFLYTFVRRQMPVNYTSRFLIDGLNFVLEDTDIIIPADIFYLSMSLQQILDIAEENETSIETGDIENIAWVMDRVMILDNNYLHLSQTLNSTNVILDSVNDIIELIAQKNLNNSSISIEDAYQIAIQPQFVVQITYPELNNITGIAISNIYNTNSFTDMIIQPLYSNSSLDEVLTIKNLEIATWLPQQMLDTLIVSTNNSEQLPTETKKLHVILTVFHNNAVFQELSSNNYMINSRIVGISIPGFESNLEHSVPIIFKKLYNVSSEDFCGYWDFNLEQFKQISGLWKRQGCFLIKSYGDIIVCDCYHLTHFGQLLTISNTDEQFIDRHHESVLNIITLVGSFLSLLGIFGVWITALVFSNWRKKAGTKVLLQLSSAIALPLIFIIIFTLDSTIFIKENGEYLVVEHLRNTCIILGASLHFSILASFVWMLITAILQFVRYVRVLGVRRPSRFMFKFTLIGWGIPLIPVIINLALDAKNYIPSPSSMKTICYPNGYYFIGGVLLPICIILVINVVLFILVLNAISRGPDQKMKIVDLDLVGAQLRVSIFLFFLLGLTWIFGIFSFSNQLIWSYLFCLTSTLQGFVLFIYFVICDPTTRNLWISLMMPQFSPKSSRNSVTTLSASTGS